MIYLILPILVFFAGFLRIVPAVVFCVAGLLCLVYAIYDLNRNAEGKALPKGERYVSISPAVIIIAAVVIILWVTVSGIGGIFRQSEDFSVRNAMFSDLINEKWPLFIDLSEQSNPEVREILGRR